MSAGAGIAGVVVLVSLALAGAASFQRGPVVFLEPPAESVAPSSAADPAAETATSRSAPASATPDQAVPSASEVAAVDPPVRPQRWAGVQREDSGIVVVFSDGERGPSLETEQDVTDLLVTDTPLGLVAESRPQGRCCGSRRASPSSSTRAGGPALSADGTVFARTDTFGVLGIWPAFPEHEHRVTRSDVAAFDVAVAPDGVSVVALSDTDLVVGSVPPVASERDCWCSTWWGRTSAVSASLPLERAYCSLVAPVGAAAGAAAIRCHRLMAEPLHRHGPGRDRPHDG